MNNPSRKQGDIVRINSRQGGLIAQAEVVCTDTIDGVTRVLLVMDGNRGRDWYLSVPETSLKPGR